MQSNVQEIKVTIEMLHHLLAIAPFGFLGANGNPHVTGCTCAPCRNRKR